MWPGYKDVLRAAGQLPLWYDDHGVPRFAPFQPNMLGVYAKFAVLMEVQCQGCPQHLLVGGSWPRIEMVVGSAEPVEHILEQIVAGWSYGDMPMHGQGCPGDTMSSIPTVTVQAWEQQNFEWVRRPDLEGARELPGWAQG